MAVRPLVLLFLLSVLLSFSLQIPLAWLHSLLAARFHPPFTTIDLLSPYEDSDTETLSIATLSRPGYRAVYVTAQPPGTMSRRYLEHNTSRFNTPEIIEACAPWSPAEVYPALADPTAWPMRTGVYSRPNMSYILQPTLRFAAGWPFLCTEGHIDYNNKTFTYSGIITDPRFSPLNPNDPGQLPYHPRWPAYLANTAIHATLLTTLLLTLSLSFKSLRTHHRQKRTRCPHCNYDLRATPPSQPCPECGHISGHQP